MEDKRNVEKIYFDLDGVLADFERGVEEICGLTPPSQNAKHHKPGSDDDMWIGIQAAGHFYDMLELMPGAKELFEAVYEKYGDRCEILTGIPKPKRGIPQAGDDKVSWTRRMLSGKVKVNIVCREDKVLFSKNPDCILIDDMERNIRDWEAAGGTGILHVSAENTMRVLREKGLL